MPAASTPDPHEPRPLSADERRILAGIEHHLDTSAPRLAREMTRPVTAARPLPAGIVETGFLVLSLFLVLAVAGLVPGVVWALLAVIGSMVLVPWFMLWSFERLDRTTPSDDPRRRDDGDDTNG